MNNSTMAARRASSIHREGGEEGQHIRDGSSTGPKKVGYIGGTNWGSLQLLRGRLQSTRCWNSSSRVQTAILPQSKQNGGLAMQNEF